MVLHQSTEANKGHAENFIRPCGYADGWRRCAKAVTGTSSNRHPTAEVISVADGRTDYS